MNGAKSKVIEDLEGAGVPGGLAPIKKALPPRSGRAITYPVLFSGRSPGCRTAIGLISRKLFRLPYEGKTLGISAVVVCLVDYVIGATDA